MVILNRLAINTLGNSQFNAVMYLICMWPPPDRFWISPWKAFRSLCRFDAKPQEFDSGDEDRSTLLSYDVAVTTETRSYL